jgi:hypothetical protein
MANSLAAVATGSASAADRHAVDSAVDDLHLIARKARGALAERLDAAGKAISALENAPRPTPASVKDLMAAFADLDSNVRGTCHFPLQ